MSFKTHRAGFTSNGVPANISVVRSLQNSLARRTAMTAGKRRELRALEEDLEAISRSETGATAGGGAPAQRDCRTAG
ncbi:YeaH [Klebsiella pneumoniae subsp. rhinoscleromatis]|nr:YeaH [Klebsiella pneumoniae subsp. rhinoscleromatis]